MQELAQTPAGSATAVVARLGGWAMWLPIGLAATVGSLFLGRKGFTSDEAVSVTLARLPWHRFGDLVVHRETNGSLYFTALHLFTNGNGGEWGARAISLVSFVLATAVFFIVVRRLFGIAMATVAASLFALSPLHVEYAQTSREYLLALLFVTTSTYLFVRGIQEPRPWVWGLYALAAAGGAYAFLLAATIPVAHLFSLAALRRDRVPWRLVAAAYGALVVLLLPLVIALSQTHAAGGVAWASGNLPGRIAVSVRNHLSRPFVAVLLLLLTIALTYAWWRLASRLPWRWVLLAAWLLVPAYLVGCAGLLWQPLFIVRYFMIFAPPLLVGVAALLLRLRPVAAVVVGTAILVIAVAGIARWYGSGSGADYRGAARHVAAASDPGDGVLFYAPFVRLPFELYFQATSAAQSGRVDPVYPSDGWRRASPRFIEAVPMPQQPIRKALRGYRRVWVVLSQYQLYGQNDPGYNHVIGALAEGRFRLVQKRSFAGLTLRRYER